MYTEERILRRCFIQSLIMRNERFNPIKDLTIASFIISRVNKLHRSSTQNYFKNAE